VVLLTNRQCFSSAEEFILMMKVRPGVTVMGDVSGGGSGNPITLELPNGWQFSVSRWVQYTAQMKFFEEVGLAPDIPAAISPADSIAGHDTVLEQAVARLRNSP
jgi:C-terminal processing protease CtpA/Prc